MTYTITTNPTFKSIEITFQEKPADAVREALKGLRFRWHNVKKVWYGYATEEQAREAIDNAGKAETPVKAAVKPTEKANKFGVKVGDIFEMSWGYEQTNVDFFQVVSLIGESSVRVVAVHPEIVSTDATCPMAEDRTYNITGKLLPAVSSIFIDDSTKGDLKRVTNGYGNEPCIKIGHHYAYKLGTGTHKAYVSWYY